ncbi:heavy metal translocating P-type ATPase [Alisedimentitalea sp. MJ-SS2]|uniref:heavy metal translocating P-type ATPase n=1 Tax=Aliisedimentitalea sp. MJ-SS2 TaxID=3049795 RepID=UPI002910EA55|nr:heavy metal translocating P-type ATPase [Alisedimentitalea sp. MJ-SS2]MDU8927139.1 heavy metal translocating P-type ATPase [Alisedimentitalea sp. MJ-SS2]
MTIHTDLHLSIQGMSCAVCVGSATKALEELDGVTEVKVNLATESADLQLATPATPGSVAIALDRAGFPARTSRAVLEIEGMTCASCVGRVDLALAALPGVTEVNVNLASETATVHYFDGMITPADLLAATASTGYTAHLRDASAPPDMGARKEAEAATLRRDVMIAAALTLPVFLIEMGGHLYPPLHHWVAATIGQQVSWMLQFLLTALVLTFPGRRFFTKGIPALLRRVPDMNSLVAMGSGAAFLFSTVVTFFPALLPAASRAVYFESAAVIVTLILVGRYLEARAKGRTGQAIARLIDLAPKTARVLRDGIEREIPADELVLDDIVLIPPGARIPADGVVTEGSSHIDESMITGEPLPVAKTQDDPVTGGTVNGTGALRIRTSAVGRDTTLSQIVRMVQDAQGARLPIQSLVDGITLWFVPVVMGFATLTLLIWLAVGPAPALTHALVAGVAVLIIACPCAMGLATPTSIMVGTGRAADLGVLFRKGDALQALQSATIIAFDKTGTLTLGKPTLTDLHLADGFDRANLLRLVGAVEAQSEHPIAHAIEATARAECGPLPNAQDFRAQPGFGIRATVDGHSVIVGAARLMAREKIALGELEDQAATLAVDGKTPLYAAIDGEIAALIAVADPLKPTTRAAVAALHDMGLKTAMITGDAAPTAHAIAREAGIDHVEAELLPRGKVKALAALNTDTETLAFVGDGINDAPALASADIGIAIGTGTDIAVEAADVVLMRGDLTGVVNAIAISRATMRNIRQNLFWAFAYNTALIPVAAGLLYPLFGLQLSPMLAAGAMALSSVFVVSNALRLRNAKSPIQKDAT